MATPNPLTPEQRRLRAQIAAHARWKQEDPGPNMARARQAFRDGFEKQVDPDGVLPEAERFRRAESARKEYYKRLAFKSARARQARARLGGDPDGRAA